MLGETELRLPRLPDDEPPPALAHAAVSSAIDAPNSITIMKTMAANAPRLFVIPHLSFSLAPKRTQRRFCNTKILKSIPKSTRILQFRFERLQPRAEEMDEPDRKNVCTAPLRVINLCIRQGKGKSRAKTLSGKVQGGGKKKRGRRRPTLPRNGLAQYHRRWGA
jgi:hypothetical protein